MELPTKLKRRIIKMERLLYSTAKISYYKGIEKERFVSGVASFVTYDLFFESVEQMTIKLREEADHYTPYVLNYYRDVLENLWEKYNKRYNNGNTTTN